MLQPFDIIQGAQSPANPRVFVIGAFDSRITFYSQQARALSIVHALRDQGVLHDDLRIAVVGAGAAGLSAASAAALLSNARVDLYERADEVIPLQRASQRRQLDPHIYDWPRVGSTDPEAELPILDWTAGSALDVRRDVKQEFEGILAATSPRLSLHLRHEIVAAREVGGGALQLDCRRDPRPGEVSNDPDGKVFGQATYDLLILAFGFGLEVLQSVPGAPGASYWTDAGVPVAEFEGRANPRFLISGNGDGGLIDLVAAASAHFDHAGMIRAIVGQPNIETIFERLTAIDARAFAAFRDGAGFDFLATYDAEIHDDISALGLFDLVSSRLRPGVRLTLQTLKPEVFTVESATLNRVAAYLVVRACERGAQTGFDHITGGDLAVTTAPQNALYEAPLWFSCAGQTFGVDAAIIRHGPGRLKAREPFVDLLRDFSDSHKAWLALHGESIVVPRLSEAARLAYIDAGRSFQLPIPNHVQRRLQAQQPTLVRVQPDAGAMRWSGDLAPDAVAALWNSGANSFDILVLGPPLPLGPVAAALIRLALHAVRASLVANAADWRTLVDSLTTGSAHAEHLASPIIRPGPSAAANRNPRSMSASDLAATLHRALNAWMLDALHRTIDNFTSTARDPGNVVGFRAAADLRVRMAVIWSGWRPQLEADPQLLDRFLRLMICAQDDDERQDEARVLVGPCKLNPIIRAVGAALAIAAVWPETSPRGDRPGNLLRNLATGDSHRGHACAAELIDREPTAIAAAAFMWRTDFIVLSQVNTPIGLAARAEAGIGEVEHDQPGIADRMGAGGVVVTLDEAFRKAAEIGIVELETLLNTVEANHFSQLAAAIERA